MNKKWIFISSFIFIVALILVPTFLVVNGTVAINLGPSTIVITEEKYNKNYEKIKINIEADVFISQRDQDGIKIEASSNQTPRIKISQTSKSIIVDSKKQPALDIKFLSDEPRPQIFVFMKQATEIEINSKSKVTIQDYKTESMDIVFNSDGSLTSTNLQIKKLNITQTLSGFVSLKGSGEELNLYSSNSSRTLMRFFPLKSAKINSQGSGAIELNVSDKLDVTIVDSSPVRYQGVPEITSNIIGTGSLTSF